MIAAITGWKPRWPNTTASSICFSGSSLASDSTIMTASPVPATTRSRSELAISSISGLSTNWPPMTPTRAAPMGPRNGTPGQGERGGGGDQGHDVGVVLHVVGEHGDDHLRLVLEALHEQRPDRPVDQARGERLLLARAAFALEKAAGNLAGGVGSLLVVDGEGEEVHAGPRALLGDHGGEHAGLAVLGEDGGIGLAGEAARLEAELASAPFNFYTVCLRHIGSRFLLRIGVRDRHFLSRKAAPL